MSQEPEQENVHSVALENAVWTLRKAQKKVVDGKNGVSLEEIARPGHGISYCTAKLNLYVRARPEDEKKLVTFRLDTGADISVIHRADAASIFGSLNFDYKSSRSIKTGTPWITLSGISGSSTLPVRKALVSFADDESVPERDLWLAITAPPGTVKQHEREALRARESYGLLSLRDLLRFCDVAFEKNQLILTFR